MSSISAFERRFIPAAEFDANLASVPVDDSGVVSVGFSDHAELQDYQQSEPHIDFDDAFGAAEVQRVEVRQVNALPEDVLCAKAEVTAIDALIEQLEVRRDAAQAVVCRFEAALIMAAAAERGAFSSFAAA